MHLITHAGGARARTRAASFEVQQAMAVLIPGKLLFLAQQHTASMAISEALGKRRGLYIAPGHATLTQIRQGQAWIEHPGRPARGPLARKVMTGKETSFTVLRNPYDTFTTWYLRSKFEGTFEAFVSTVGRSFPSPYVRDNEIRWHADTDIRLRYERLPESFDEFMRVEGFEEIELPIKNVTKGKQPWKSYYSQQALDTVNERFSLDIAAMGYRLMTHIESQPRPTQQRKKRRMARIARVPLTS